MGRTHDASTPRELLIQSIFPICIDGTHLNYFLHIMRETGKIENLVVEVKLDIRLTEQ